MMIRLSLRGRRRPTRFLGMLLGDDDDDDSDEEDSEDDLDIEFGDEIDENDK